MLPALLMPIVASVGVPIAKKLLARAIGEDNAAIAAPVIEGVASALGVAPTVDAIVTAHNENPAQVREAFQIAETTNSADWAAALESVNQTMRAEMNAPGQMTRTWRPAFGWGFAVVFNLLGLAIIVSVIIAEDRVAALVGITNLLWMWIGAGAAVLGVYVSKRSKDKELGVG